MLAWTLYKLQSCIRKAVAVQMRAGAFHGAHHGPRLPEVSQLPQTPCNTGTINSLYSFRSSSSRVAAGRRAGLVTSPGPKVRGNTPSTPRGPQHNPGFSSVSGNSRAGSSKPGTSKPAKAGVALGKGGQPAGNGSGKENGGDEVSKLNAKKILDKVEGRMAQSMRLWCRALDYGSFMDCFANLIMVRRHRKAPTCCGVRLDEGRGGRHAWSSPQNRLIRTAGLRGAWPPNPKLD